MCRTSEPDEEQDFVQIIASDNYLVVAVFMGFPSEHVGESHLAILAGELGTERNMVRGAGGAGGAGVCDLWAFLT